MEDICLVYTRTSQQGRLGTHAFDLVLPPLGLAYLAAVLEREGFSVRILDAFAEGLSTEETFERLENRFRMVGFYCHTQNYPAIVNMAKHLKASAHPPHIVIGGPHATALPRECLTGNDAIDSLVYGEGELTIVELAGRVLQGRDLRGVRGIYYKQDGEIAAAPPRPRIGDLDSLPMPAWHLFPMKRYHHSFVEADGKPSLHVMGSRGCFSDCNYCHSTKMWGGQVRWHSPERVLAEIDHLRENYGIRYFQFFDDVFTIDPERLKRLMPEFRRRGLSDNWSCSTRIDLLNEEVVRDLKSGGVHHVAIGMETVNDRLLEVINKHVTKKQTLETIALCDKHDLPVLGMFILGLPTETREETLETLEFARNSNLMLAIFSFFTPYPGTNFWHQLKDSPDLTRDFSKYNLSQNFSYVEKHRSREELQGLMRRAYLDFYLRPRVMFSLTKLMLKNPSKLLETAGGFAAALYSLAAGSRPARHESAGHPSSRGRLSTRTR